MDTRPPRLTQASLVAVSCSDYAESLTSAPHSLHSPVSSPWEIQVLHSSPLVLTFPLLSFPPSPSCPQVRPTCPLVWSHPVPVDTGSNIKAGCRKDPPQMFK